VAAPGFENWPDVSGPYIGQKPPEMEAELFAPEIISTDQSETGSVFSPDHDDFYFTTWTKETGTKILVTSQVGGVWTAPQIASFSNHPSDVDVAISVDGTKVFFGTRRPRPGEVEDRQDGFDIWYANRTEAGWGKEKYLGPTVNSGKSQVYPTVTRNGTLYFQAVREEGYGKADIYRSRLVDGVYQTPENLGPNVNSEHYEGDVYVDPDESYLIVSIHGREDDIGDGDLYISFTNPDSTWSPPKNMGPAVNSDKRDFCPMVTPDGKYLFFSSKRLGVGDIFWVSAVVIEASRDD
jgi:Tol biopolymer transport system component